MSLHDQSHTQGSLLLNLAPAGLPYLLAAAESRGLAARICTPASLSMISNTDVVIWQADEHTDLSDEQIAALSERIRLGASLLLTLGSAPGKLPMRLSVILPTTGWATQINYPDWYRRQQTSVSFCDSEVFPKGEAEGLTFPFFFPIRPFSAVERGEARYERYAQKIAKLNRTVDAGSNTWTRSLLNRDWRVRLSASDRGNSPLLITGRYGAGHVAVLAGHAEAIEGYSGAKSTWSALLRWLTASPAQPVSPLVEPPGIAVQVQHGVASIQITNTSAQPISCNLVVRALTWEGALIGDIPTEPLSLPALGASTQMLPLPEPSSVGYQALSFRHALQLRVGILSADGATLLVEHRVALDLRPDLRVNISAGNLNAVPNPFHTPYAKTLRPFAERMGALISTYAYPPGATVDAAVELSNGLRNLAPFASIHDLTSPQNLSVMALNDDSVNNKTPLDGIQAFSVWRGKSHAENVLQFRFPQEVTVASITLVGTPGESSDGRDHNPATVIITCDGKQVARITDLDARFQAGYGQASLTLSPYQVEELTLRFPWPNTEKGRRRAEPWLAEVLIDGWIGEPSSPVHQQLIVTLEDAMTDTSVEILRQSIVLTAGARRSVQASFTMPILQSDMGFYRLRARYGNADNAVAILDTSGKKVLPPITDILPEDAASLGFIVTRGFRNVFNIGTGTAEIGPTWAQPDDLIWAYSRQLKQIHREARTQASKLYVTDDDMRHYATPWKSFSNGEFFYEIATPLLVERMEAQPNWSKCSEVTLEHSDRWDTGPEMKSLHSWQDFVEFDRELRRNGHPGLRGKTRHEIADEIHDEHESAWQGWHLHRYTGAVSELRKAFANKQKELTIIAQGLPIVAGESGDALAATIRGMSDDSTWGIVADSIPLTTGRQLAEVAWNPVWKISTQGMWAYNSGVLNNEHWHSPVGTTEPSRRTMYNRAWRGMVWADGTYGSVYSFGFNSNVGASYTMADNDWQQWWLMQQRHCLLWPEQPLGAGLVLSSAFFADPAHLQFSCGDALEANPLLPQYAMAFEKLYMAGVSISFGANASTLDRWTGNAPLILFNPDAFSEEEVSSVLRIQARGVPIAACGSLRSGPALRLYNVPGIFQVEQDPASLSQEAASQLASSLHRALRLPIVFPSGTTGYGFLMGATKFIVLEDWQEEGREVVLLVQARTSAKIANACDVNEHTRLNARAEGTMWAITVPLRPGDGTIIALTEEV
ncbi:hypothetical protein [Edaphobacter dinghuensis]|uniref:Uncharacterized protein n=1 Tax=Edaphobacter dinghuensis TaxID=1560005 RepID=A0A917GZU3_9BACT|nr:hypothetical protein [Edaphobacter dinghuensis]GGG62867.1 hypothetical protein GCM10011585_00350 [Edaphobacter dinghuensis]